MNEGKQLQIKSILRTPAFIIDEESLDKSMQQVSAIRKEGVKVLYTLKPFINRDVMTKMLGHLDGFSVTSLFEAKIARDVSGTLSKVHFGSPGLRPDEIEDLNEICGHITFNSLSQFSRLKTKLSKHVKCGLRVNPELSYVHDARYNPCCKSSRLGIPLNEILKAEPTGFSGIHFHTNADSSDFTPLLETVKHLSEKIGCVLEKMEWVNLGGGVPIQRKRRLSTFL